MIEPLELTYEAACSPEHAFAVWTQHFSSWWPKGHSVSGDAGVDVFFEPRVGGRIYERSNAGTEIDWGEVTLWDPPTRLGYMWHIRRDRADATDVEIAFIETADGTTRIEITHSGWERLGDGAEDWREANRGGWGGLIPHFVAAVEAV
jgi:hypothetical protein